MDRLTSEAFGEPQVAAGGRRQPRKTCDLCYTRKLKCDRKGPRCSNCVTYDHPCTHSAKSRPSRLKAGRDRKTGLDDHEEPPAENPARDLQSRPDDAQTAVEGGGANFMGLPPLQDAIELVGVFLNSVNSVLPLFHPDSLLCMVGQCYGAPPRQRDPIQWAAVNVVLALAHQHGPASSSAEIRNELTNRHLNNAQSIVSELMLGDVSLLNVQVLVGMAMVLQTARYPTAALILVSGTMRLVHQLGLHDRATSAHLSAIEQRQRRHVFWLAYILDKSLSLRAKQPSVQLDDDIDLDLPCLASIAPDGDEAGVIVSAQGASRMNYFAARVQLANIEGGVYDLLYSTRAMNRSPEDRHMAVQSLVTALDTWRASVPPGFTAARATDGARENQSTDTFLCVLHGVSLQCITYIREAHAWDEQWVARVDQHRRGTTPMQLPAGWDSLVSEARDFMILSNQTWTNQVWCRWMVSCSYITAMVLLTANNLRRPWHDQSLLDAQLVDNSLAWLEDVITTDGLSDLRRLKDVCENAARVVRQKREERILLDNAVDPFR